MSATMAISAAAGISVFATGGIGGVHRGVADSWDVSADISALARIPQIVVCAGAKSILDIPKTLEALETVSVPVLVLGSNTFPAFYTRGTLPAPARIQSPLEAAQVFYYTRKMGTGSGVLLAVPLAAEFEADGGTVERATQQALEEMEKLTAGLRPQQVTPFLLKRVAEITKGESLRANMQLAKNNAAVAAQVAVQLCALEKNGGSFAHLEKTKCDTRADEEGFPAEVLVVGGVALDIQCDASRDGILQMRASNRGSIRQCLGGVGRNVAHSASRLGGVRVSFVSAVGDDVLGKAVVSMLRESADDARGVRILAGRRTATCCVVHDEKGDMAVSWSNGRDGECMRACSLQARSGANLDGTERKV